MGKLVVFVIAFGLLIGLALPSGKNATAAASTSAAGEKEVVLTRGSTGHFFTDAKVNDHGPVEFIVDTGASIVALSMADARALGVEVDPSNFTVVGEGAGGPVRGQEIFLASVDVGGIKVEHVAARPDLPHPCRSCRHVGRLSLASRRRLRPPQWAS